MDVPIGIQEAQVARREPPVRVDGGLGGALVVEITTADHRPSDVDFAGLPGGEHATRFIADLDLRIWRAPPRGEDLVRGVADPQKSGPSGLAQPVPGGCQGLRPLGGEAFEQLVGDRRPRHHHEAERRVIGTLSVV